MEMSPEKGASEVCFPHACMRVPKFLFPLRWIRTASSNDASLQSERAITVVKKRILFYTFTQHRFLHLGRAIILSTAEREAQSKQKRI
jgi:hypothetical protein